jgi:hypothetical protein
MKHNKQQWNCFKRSSESLISILIQNHIKKVSGKRWRGEEGASKRIYILCKRRRNPERVFESCETLFCHKRVENCFISYSILEIITNNAIKQFTNWDFLLIGRNSSYIQSIIWLSGVVATFPYFHFLSLAKLKDQVLSYWCVRRLLADR